MQEAVIISGEKLKTVKKTPHSMKPDPWPLTPWLHVPKNGTFGQDLRKKSCTFRFVWKAWSKSGTEFLMWCYHFQPWELTKVWPQCLEKLITKVWFQWFDHQSLIPMPWEVDHQSLIPMVRSPKFDSNALRSRSPKFDPNALRSWSPKFDSNGSITKVWFQCLEKSITKVDPNGSITKVWFQCLEKSITKVWSQWFDHQGLTPMPWEVDHQSLIPMLRSPKFDSNASITKVWFQCFDHQSLIPMLRNMQLRSEVVFDTLFIREPVFNQLDCTTWLDIKFE